MTRRHLSSRGVPGGTGLGTQNCGDDQSEPEDACSNHCRGLFLGNSTALLCLFVSQNPKSKIPIDKPRRIFRRGTNNNTISKT